MMPNKTIYVSEVDLPIFERAQTLANESLSATVAKALRLFVEKADRTSRGFETVELRVGKNSMKRFQGKLIEDWKPLHATVVNEKYQIFLTPKEKVVVYVVKGPDIPVNLPAEMYRRIVTDRVEYKFDVYDTLEYAKWSIPEELYERLESILIKETIEELDI